MERREFFKLTGGVAALGLWSQLLPGSSAALGNVIDTSSHIEPAAFAQDEAFWRKIRTFYTPPTDFLDLDHANTSPTSSTVFNAFVRRSKQLTQAPAERFGDLWMETGKFRPELARLLGTKENHFALTSNATVALNTVLHGFPMSAGDEISVTNHEYPDMVEVVLQRAKRDGVVMKKVAVAGLDEDKLTLVDRVKKAITRKTKLFLISHVSAWSGEILPVAEVTRVARERGVAVLVDAAQSVGMLDVNFEAIRCDFLATSLHKWMGGPITTGVLVMKPEHVGKVWPLHPPSWETKEYPMDIYEWTGSVNMAANASIGEAIAFQKILGPERKLARMRYLGKYWQERLREIPKVNFLTPTQPDRSFGVASFAIDGMPSSAVMRYLRKEKGILVQDKSGRHSPFSNALRVSPGPCTTLKELDQFVAAVKRLATAGLPPEYAPK